MSTYDSGFRTLSRPRRSGNPTTEADAFNEAHPTGTRLRYWKGLRQGAPSGVAALAVPASVIGDTVVVWLESVPGCIAITHVERAAPGEADAEVSRKAEDHDASPRRWTMSYDDEIVSAERALTMKREAKHGAAILRDHARATGDEDRAEEYLTHAEDLDGAAQLAHSVIALHARVAELESIIKGGGVAIDLNVPSPQEP